MQIDTGHFIALIGFALIVWYWRDSLAAREATVAAARRACNDMGVQLLDQTVSLVGRGVSLRDGPPRLRRRYRFEFSTDGSDRCLGHAETVGHRVVRMHLEDPSGIIHS